MKKLIACIGFGVLLSTTMVAQTKTNSKLGTQTKLSKTDSLMCGKMWRTTSVEEQGVVSKPNDQYKNDLLLMNTDMRFNLILAGVKKSGIWYRSGQSLNMVDGATEEKTVYKVLAVEATKIKVSYHNADGTDTFFVMESK